MEEEIVLTCRPVMLSLGADGMPVMFAERDRAEEEHHRSPGTHAPGHLCRRAHAAVLRIHERGLKTLVF